MGIVVIACYRPKPGKVDQLVEEMRRHVPTLRELDLVTDRQPITAQAADGTVVEVFEWRSQEAIDSAHANPTVLAMWARYDECCEYVPITEVPEAAQLFSPFAPLEI